MLAGELPSALPSRRLWGGRRGWNLVEGKGVLSLPPPFCVIYIGHSGEMGKGKGNTKPVEWGNRGFSLLYTCRSD